MGVRGQKPEAWVARFRAGTCPIHGKGLVVDSVAGVVDGGETVRCLHNEPEPCTIVARRWPGKDRFHHRFGLVTASDEIRAALRQGNDIDDDGKPTRWTRESRTSYPIEDLEGEGTPQGRRR